MKPIDYSEITIQKLKYLNYSSRTIDCYNHYLREFLTKCGQYPSSLTSKDLQNYLNEYSYTSISQQNQVISVLKFFYEKVLNRKYLKVSFTRPRKNKKLPQPIDSAFLKERIETINNLKHKTILSLAFSTGIRVGELINLKIKDIDSNRMLIKVVQGKGKKDRYVPLSSNILDLLRKYYIQYKPVKYLFNGQGKERYFSGSCNKLVKKYIGPEYHFHQLGHSCFTALHEAGISLRDIQKIAGHSSSKTTEVYTYVSNKHLSQIQLPL